MLQEKTQTKLTKEELQTIGILSIGTFLEYFDKMLYLHTSVILNDLFFPDTHPIAKSLIPAFSFCTNYLLTPFGSIFFGYLGDTIGRRSAIVLSSILTSICCLTVAFLPTYAQIGISATILLTICRMIQGMSGIAEITGVEIYLTESIRHPFKYQAVALPYAISTLGSAFALGITAFFTNITLVSHYLPIHGWRVAFFIGSIIGIVGAITRSSIKEALEFTDRQKLLKEQFKKANIEWSKNNPSINPKIPLSTSVAYFFVHCGMPVCAYFIYWHCGSILHNTFGFTSAQVIRHNLFPTILNVLALLCTVYCSAVIAPIKIIKLQTALFVTGIIFFLIAFNIWHSSNTILLFQCILVFVRFDYMPAAPIFFKHFPTLKRFRYAILIRAFSTLSTFGIVSIGFELVTKEFGINGTLFILIPIVGCFAWGLNYFEGQEAKERERTLARQKSTFSEHF
jgi:MFS transporter, MHS family, proline/betaine transporter